MESGKKGYYSLRQVLEKAVDFENDSALFYRHMKVKTTEPKTLDLLNLLERQETEHETTLQRLLGKEALADVYIQFPPELTLAMPETPAGDPGFSALLDIAIERETLSAEIYMTASKDAPTAIRTLLESLSEFERIHERGLKELKLA